MIIKSTGTHYTREDVEHRLALYSVCVCGRCPQQAVFWLARGDTVCAMNPADTGAVIRGPGRVEFVRQSYGALSVVAQ